MRAICSCNHRLTAAVWSKVLQVEVARGGGFARMDDAWREWIQSMFQWVQNKLENHEQCVLQDWAATKKEGRLLCLMVWCLSAPSCGDHGEPGVEHVQHPHCE